MRDGRIDANEMRVLKNIIDRIRLSQTTADNGAQPTLVFKKHGRRR